MADQRETRIDVSHNLRYGPSFNRRPNLVDGSTVEITIPFDGDPEIFSCRPSCFNYSPPRAAVGTDCLILSFTGIDQRSGQVKAEIDRAIENLQMYLNNLRADTDPFNSSLCEFVKQVIESRRTRLLANQNLVASLGFALKENPLSPQTYSAPKIRRKLAPTPPSASSAPYRPEPVLAEKDYEHILINAVVEGVDEYSDVGRAGSWERPDYQPSVGRPSISSKCRSPVTTVRSYCRALAAIQMSFSGIGRPRFRSWSLISP